MFSTGICIFSKYPILETFYLSYPLSGYPHKVLHKVVDWFLAKGVALACIQSGELHVNVYVTHVSQCEAVADPGFLRGGGANPRGVINIIFDNFFPKTA